MVCDQQGDFQLEAVPSADSGTGLVLILFSIFINDMDSGPKCSTASLLVVQTGAGADAALRVLPSTGTSMSWRNGLRGASGNSAGQEQLQAPALMGAGMLAEKALGVLLGKRLTVSQQGAFVAVMASCTLGCVRSRGPAGPRS